MVAAVAFCTEFDPERIPTNIGFITIGAITSCCIRLIYSFITLRNNKNIQPLPPTTKDESLVLLEASIFGIFIGISLLIAFLLQLGYPYWLPTSCVAVMQGTNTKHILTRGLQRSLGTISELA